MSKQYGELGLYLVGLTGGIGTGKSTVSSHLRCLGARVIDADEISHSVTSKDSEGLRRIVAEFGDGVLRQDGSLHRKKLGRIVFGDENSRSVLDCIVHPLVLAEIDSRLKELASAKISTEGRLNVVLDVPLLFEAGFDKMCHETWVVFTNAEVQLERLMKRDGYSKEQAVARIKAQMPLEEKIRRANKVMNNSGSVESLKKQVETLFLDLKRRLEEI